MWTKLYIVCACAALGLAAPAQETADLMPEARIINGRLAVEGMFPYMVALSRNGTYVCGGAIIAPEYIITAAQCVTDKVTKGVMEPVPAAQLSIRVGSLDRLQGGVVSKISQVTVHEDYIGKKTNDLAILRLPAPLNYTEAIGEVRITHWGITGFAPLNITGWGSLSINGAFPRLLHWQTDSALTSNDCALSTWIMNSSVLCAGRWTGNGICTGDMGGPAVGDGRLHGIANWVGGKCGSDSPNGYADIYYFRDWIKIHANLTYY
ncbi:maker299 [Drosophila busckii]|uniref:trypsin n=1 Tax=Drosophila busckii TaxID=30019 RepID=A0A0M4F8R9_DROBS|nr:trypsin alpha [Drosophila busckii]ALC48825.1 maker299 [Drosophila busckii]